MTLVIGSSTLFALRSAGSGRLRTVLRPAGARFGHGDTAGENPRGEIAAPPPAVDALLPPLPPMPGPLDAHMANPNLLRNRWRWIKWPDPWVPGPLRWSDVRRDVVFLTHGASGTSSARRLAPWAPREKAGRWFGMDVPRCVEADPRDSNRNRDRDDRDRNRNRRNALRAGAGAPPAAGEWRCLPRWIVAGAPKGGTSSLFVHITSHPDVQRPRKKEICGLLRLPAAFNNVAMPPDPALGVARNVEGRAVDPLRNYRLTLPPVADPGRQQTGEACPNYMGPTAFPHILRAVLPNAHVLFVLRDPVAMVLSAWNMMKRYKDFGLRGDERLGDHLACHRGGSAAGGAPMACVSTHHQTNTYLRWGMYALHLEHFFTVMPPSARYIVIHSEAFFAETAGIMAEVIRHLGLPPHDYAAHENLATRFNGAGHCVMPPGTAALRGSVMAHRCKRAGGEWKTGNSAGDASVEMDPQLREDLVAFFHPFNLRLYELLGADLGWPRPRSSAAG